MDAATLRQNQAAEPEASTWLSANAGSGKTRVLTDRVARLLLNKVRPQNILCLTYTKAAASEMQNRLFARLGEWSMKPDGELAEALAKLGVDRLDDADRLAEARRLFARAIETPGGLRIQTIHSFCAALLRRFPLEAGVSPRFVEMDERAAALLRDEIIEELAAGDGVGAVDGIAAYLSDLDLSKLTGAAIRHREAFSKNATAVDALKWFGLPAGFDTAQLLAETFIGPEQSLFVALLAVLATGSARDRQAHAKLSGVDISAPDIEALYALAAVFLNGKSAAEPYAAKTGKFPTKASRAALGDRADELDAFMLRIEAAREQANRLYSVQKTLALYRFAARFLPAYSARKQARGWLDFDDLILKTGALLGNEAVAAWVLYRLDGGLDHILVDEAQDTSPAQWQVIERLAQEFTSGQGARDDVMRTIFVVGDKKQSIYSFQGADPREFDRMQAHFRDRLAAIKVGLRSLELEYSFRSSDAILRFVDRTIGAQDNPHPITQTKHRAFHAELPGRVDLWPAVPVTDRPEKRHWYDPVDIVTEDHQDVILARKIADHIQMLIGTETIPAENGSRKLISAGDILILVRRRSQLFEEIIRACKARDLPVAGADRLKLGAELAVKDLSALLSFLATPEDDLSLAAVLRSPLFGWSEADLYDLAAGRAEPYLWAALRNAAESHPQTLTILNDLRRTADFLRPYDLIERILTRHDGRRRLLARLGPEAEDGIDALLGQSLAFERMEIPSLTGFLVWMQTDDVEVKRQMDNAGDLIRVMTVHGAKGLEAPIVILPDTAKRTISIKDEIVTLNAGQPVWKPVADRQPEVVRSALSRLKTAQEEEAQRLFYVAMTRAETWLIIAAAGEVGKTGESWHQMAEAGLRQLGAVGVQTPTGPGLRYQHGDWSGGAVVETGTVTPEKAALPGWAEARIEPVERPAASRAPSDLGGAKALWSETETGDDEAALRHGRQVHRLLEHLPGTPPDSWPDLAVGLLATGPDGTDANEARRVLDAVMPLLNAPDLAFLFTQQALSEVDITADLPELGNTRISGAIDRLIIAPDRVLAVDFKTNAALPDGPEHCPEGLLRQMGAYQSALEQVYPDRQVQVAILWTRGPVLMPLPHDIVRQALRRAATS